MNDHLRQQWRARITAAQEEWRGRHQPSFGPPIHNLTEPENEEHDWSAPDDIYEHAHYYGDGNTDSDKESTAVMRRARAGGAEHPVTIYRAAPRGVTHIGHGDWVTPSKSYAKGHSLHETDEDKDWPVYKATVPAKHVRWAGDSINEYGYFGPPVKAEIHDPGGPNAESVRAAHTSALTHLAAEWMYHHTPKENRESIREQGLRPSNPYDPSIHELGPEQAPEGVYLHDDPEDDRTSYGHDTWKVDTEGLSLRDDPDDPNHEYGFKYHPNGIKPERLTLHHMAAIDDESISHQDSFRQPLHVHFTDRGTVGNRTHITREDRGLVPIDMVRHMLGAMGEKPGEHRNRQGEDWESFKDDVKRNGIQNPLFITVDHNEAPRLAEGNHRRDAAVELGHTHVPVQVRYFGHAEQQGTLEERHRLHHTAGEAPTYYHGTRWPLRPGQLLTPKGGQDRSSWGYGQTDDHVYFTQHHDVARQFADAGYGPPDRLDAPPHVYQVEPTGPHERDELEDPQHGCFKTQHPVRVIRRVSVTAGLTQEHWDYLSRLHDRLEQTRDPRVCSQVSNHLSKKFGWDVDSGFYRGTGHYWNRMADGTIVDATHDQFEPGEDPVRVVPPDDPGQREYHSERKQAAIHTAETVSGGWGRGSWVTPEGEKLDIPDGTEHGDHIPESYKGNVAPYMRDTHHVRLRSVGDSLNVQMAHPLTGKQKDRILQEADKHKRFSVGVILPHPTTSDWQAVHYDDGPADNAERLLTRAHNRARQVRS